MDKLIDALAASGPWGIVCATLAAANAAQWVFMHKLLIMLVDSQKERIDEGRKAQESVNKQTEIYHGLRDAFYSLRDSVLSARRAR